MFLSDDQDAARLREELGSRIAARYRPALLDSRPPPFEGKWQPLGAAETGNLLARAAIDLARGGDRQPWPLAHEALALRCIPLPCYGHALFVDAVVQDRLGRIGHAALVVHAAGVVALETTSGPIHALNEAAPIDVSDAETALCYLRFFCWTVCGDNGPFMIVEHADQCPRDIADAATAELVRGAVVPAIAQPSTDGKFTLSAAVHYGGALFAAKFDLTPDGMIEMVEDDPIADFGPAAPGWHVAPYVRYVAPPHGRNY